MQSRTGKMTSKDWPSVAICLAVSLTAALVMALAKYFYGQYFYSDIPKSFFSDPNNQRLLWLLNLGYGASLWSGFYTICLSISLCGSIFKSWLRWPILLGATLIAGAYPSFLHGTPDQYCGWQLIAIETVTISFALMLVTQRLLGEFSLGRSKSQLSAQIPLSDFFSLTFICSAFTLALTCMRPTSFLMPIPINFFILLVASACVSLPVPIVACVAFSNSKRRSALLSLVLLIPALAITLHFWMNDGSSPEFALMFILSQLALYVLVTALRFRGIRIIAGG